MHAPRPALPAVLALLSLITGLLLATPPTASAASTAAPLPSREVLAPTVTTLTGPGRVVDERRIVLRITWLTTTGEPVLGRVSLQRRSGHAWIPKRTVTTAEDGTAVIDLAPRNDSRWRAVSLATPTAAGSISSVHVVDNVAPGRPVVLPRSAPRPRVRLAAQPRATLPGAAPRIMGIPGAVWRSMVGRSWHRGCPVGRGSLRLVKVNYWAFDGYRRQGEVVVAASVARQVAAALSDLYDARIPIRSMYRVDRFGWSKRLRGADDYRSMAADNTSAFNCRWVVGRPGVRSPHSYGRSLDINTWENPYRSRHGWVPNSWWAKRSDPRVAWRSARHPVVRIMASHGLRWTYRTSDSQHFDAVPRGQRRVVVVPGCGDAVCH